MWTRIDGLAAKVNKISAVFVKCSFKAINSVKSCYGPRRGAKKVEMWSKVL